MKKAWGILIAAALCGMLAACGGSREESTGIRGEDPSEAPAPTASAIPENSPEPAAGAEISKMRSAFMTALTNLMERHILPDGTDCGYDEINDLAMNQFAVYDVDGDGAEELIVLYTTTFTAGMQGCVFGYEEATGTLKTELCEYPQMTFYDNGMVRADWSHNQGLGGAFWPYTLYRYDGASDSYQPAAMVDAWDRSFAATSEEGDPFPEDADVTKTGVVYYVMTDGEYARTEPMDAAAYEAWIDGQTGGAAEVQLPFAGLTAESIAALAA